MVIMEELDPSWVSLEGLKGQARTMARQAALETLQRAHRLHVPGLTGGCVHGDVRDPNVMVAMPAAGSGPGAGGSGGTDAGVAGPVAVKFVDFDWAGEHGVGRYPLLMSRRVGWAPGAGDNQIMLQEHDTQLLASGGGAQGPGYEYYSWQGD